MLRISETFWLVWLMSLKLAGASTWDVSWFTWHLTVAHVIVTLVVGIIVVSVRVIVTIVAVEAVSHITAIATTVPVSESWSPVSLTPWVRVDFYLFDIDFLAIYLLLGSLEELVYDIPRVEGDKAEAFALVLCFVKRSLQLYDCSVLAKIVLDVVVRDFRGESAHENLPMLCFLAYSLRINLEIEDL